MAEQFGLALEDTLVQQLARHYPQASGRDIKGLAKLVGKYCHHKQLGPTMAVFDRCAMFRALDPVEG
jgi:hypothetical protein